MINHCGNLALKLNPKVGIKHPRALGYFLLLLLIGGKTWAQESFEVSTDTCILKLDQRNGNLIGLHWLNPNEEIIKEGRLGENFRLLLPFREHQANYFLSGDQKAHFTRLPNGVICHYDRLKNERQTLDIKVDYKIESVNGQLQFSISVGNPTQQPLAEVFYGIIGGQKGLRNRTDNQTLIPSATTNLNGEMFTRFSGGNYGGGNLGITYSAGASIFGTWSMSMSWMEVFNPKENIGMYYAQHDPTSRIATLYYEFRPSEKGNVIGDNWPSETDVPPGTPIGLTMGWLNTPYTRNDTFASAPVVLQLHAGDWHTGSSIYRRWYDRHFDVKREPSWLRKEMAWQSIIMSNGEDAIHYRFTDLPGLAAGAKQYGVTTFEILGWNKGGIDTGYPEYEPDPRLGTKQEFQEALRKIRGLGMHPLVFTNIQFVNTDTRLYNDKLKKYARKSYWADDLTLMGWGEGTIGARIGFTKHQMTLMTPSYPEVSQLLLDYHLALVKDGAAGFQMDKVNVMDLDFNPLLKVGPDQAMPQGVLNFYKKVLTEGRKINPSLAIASEVFWDRAFQYVDVSYLRMNSMDMTTALRYTFPEWTSTIFAEDPFDFDIMNNGMRYGLVWAMAPRHYNESLDEPVTRPLSRYVAELIRIRKEHAPILFNGRFMDTFGATVKCGENSRYSVFENMANRREKAVVLVNFDQREDEIEVTVDGAPGKAELCIPFEADQAIQLPAKIKVPARTCAVVVPIN